jgi:hypothetical protein
VQQTITGDIETLRQPWERLNQSIVSAPIGLAALPIAAVVVVGVLVFNPIGAPLVTFEGRAFGRYVSAALLLEQLLIGLALVQLVYLWWGLRRLLRRMARHPLVTAYDRVPRHLAPIGLYPRVPALMELEAPVARWSHVVYAGASMASATTPVPVEALQLTDRFQEDMKRSPETPWSTSRTWTTLIDAASHTAAKLQARWKSGEPMPRLPDSSVAGAVASERQTKGGSTSAVAVSDVPAAIVELANQEEVVAMSMALIVRDAIARLGYNILFLTGGALLMFCSHTLFPFQRHRALEAITWSYILLTVAAILTVVVQMKRDEILTRLASTTPGERTTWDAEFIIKLTVFGLLPLATLFAAQFPDIGGVLLRWLEPVQKALP